MPGIHPRPPPSRSVFFPEIHYPPPRRRGVGEVTRRRAAVDSSGWRAAQARALSSHLFPIHPHLPHPLSLSSGGRRQARPEREPHGVMVACSSPTTVACSSPSTGSIWTKLPLPSPQTHPREKNQIETHLRSGKEGGRTEEEARSGEVGVQLVC